MTEMQYGGALFQVTAGSFTGVFGRNVKKNAARLAHMDMVHFLGSDAHSSTGRVPGMGQGRECLEKILNRHWEPHYSFDKCEYVKYDESSEPLCV